MRRVSLQVRGLLTAVAVTAGLLTGVVSAPSAAASDAGTLVSSINAARRSAGLPALSSNGALTSVARSWAASMAASQQLAHNPRLSSQVSGWRVLGENVGTGGSASSIHQAFMSSAPHRANILSSRYTQVGVAAVTGGGRLWVVEVFRLPTGASAPVTAPKATPKATAKPKVTATPHRSTSRSVSPKPRAAAKPPTTKSATQPKPATSARPTTPPSRSAAAAPALDQAPLTLDAVLRHVRLALTSDGDPVAAWTWLMRRLLGLRTAIGA
jgi:hypothetical protein